MSTRPRDTSADAERVQRALRERGSLAPLVARLVPALEAAELTYMIVGSVAAGIHGAPRDAPDLDLVIDGDRFEHRAFVSGLSDATYYVDRDRALEAWRARGWFNLVDIETGYRVDLRVRRIHPFSREELARRRTCPIEGVEAFVATAEDTILGMLEWGHVRESAAIVVTQRDALDRAYIDRWARELGVESEWMRVARGLRDADGEPR
ncbi:MAG TPA: hypothetical protein VL463_31530 [Kofleriaceae bacterium]|nr:hypothetical protein [Kofleriaceae bacterium]